MTSYPDRSNVGTPCLSATESTLMTWRNFQGRNPVISLMWKEWCIQTLVNGINSLPSFLKWWIKNHELPVWLGMAKGSKGKNRKCEIQPKNTPWIGDQLGPLVSPPRQLHSPELCSLLLRLSDAKPFRCPKLSTYKSPQKLKNSQNQIPQKTSHKTRKAIME